MNPFHTSFFGNSVESFQLYHMTLNFPQTENAGTSTEESSEEDEEDEEEDEDSGERHT